MNANSPITTHILDISRGAPAVGVAVRLELLTAPGEWQLCGEGVTNGDGRLTDLLTPSDFTTGSYRLTFATGDYFTTRGVPAFFPQVTLEFTVSKTAEHYHVPLLLSPFGYSTYRGS